MKIITKTKAGGYKSIASGVSTDGKSTLNLSVGKLREDFNSFGENGRFREVQGKAAEAISANTDKLLSGGMFNRLKGLFGRSK